MCGLLAYSLPAAGLALDGWNACAVRASLDRVCVCFAYSPACQPNAGLALAVMFQGAVALPMAFGLQKLLGFPAGHPENPLTSLSVYLAMTQTVAIPAAVLTYVQTPTLVPAVFAAIVGAHFLPYAWLQQTRVYIALSVSVSLGSWLIMAILGGEGYRIVPWFVGASLLVGAVVLLLGQRSGRQKGAMLARGRR